MSDTLPVPLAERLAADAPELISARQIAAAVGVAVVTVRKWVTTENWPAAAEKRGREMFFSRVAVEEWLREHEAGRLDAGALGDDPDEMLTTRQISERTGYPQGTVSSYPSLYGAGSNDPFPPADAVGRRRAGDVYEWFSRRRTRNGARAVAVKPTVKVKRPPVARDVIDVHGVAEATGKSLAEAKLLMRRRSLVAMQLDEKVGRLRVWPRKELLAELRRLERQENEPAPLPGPSKNAALRHRLWLAGGPKTRTEIADHYGVSISAVMKRIERAMSGEAERQPPEPVDPDVKVKRYDPVAFDKFWRGGTDGE